MRLASWPKVGEHRVRGDHFTHRNVVYAKRDRWSFGEVAADTGFVPYIANPVHAHLLRDTHGGDVERLLESLPHGHRAAELVVVVLRLPHLVAGERYLDRLILDDCCRSDAARGDGRCIRKWLGGGAELPAHQTCAIELRAPEIRAAN